MDPGPLPIRIPMSQVLTSSMREGKALRITSGKPNIAGRARSLKENIYIKSFEHIYKLLDEISDLAGTTIDKIAIPQSHFQAALVNGADGRQDACARDAARSKLGAAITGSGLTAEALRDEGTAEYTLADLIAVAAETAAENEHRESSISTSSDRSQAASAYGLSEVYIPEQDEIPIMEMGEVEKKVDDLAELFELPESDKLKAVAARARIRALTALNG